MFAEFIKNAWENIKESDFNFWDILVPMIINAAGAALDAWAKGEELNDEMKGMVRVGYYASFEFYDNLVKNPDKTYTDEFLKEFQKQCEDLASEGKFELDIPSN